MSPSSRSQGRLAVAAPGKPTASVGAAQPLARSPTVLLLVDVVNPFDFPEAPRLEPAARTAARAIARLKDRLARSGALTVYANDNYGRWRSDFRDILDGCHRRGGTAAEIARRLAPTEHDLVILKPRHSAFFATPLDLILGQVHARRLVIAGYAADICVQLTAMDASLRGFELWVPGDCTAAESPREKAEALAYMRRVLKADTRTAARRRELD